MDARWIYYDDAFSVKPFIDDVADRKITKSAYKRAMNSALSLGPITYVGTFAPLKKQKNLSGIILRVTQEFGDVEQCGLTVDETGVVGAFQGVIRDDKFDMTQYFLRNADRIHKELRWEGNPKKTLGGLYVMGEISSGAKTLYTFELVHLPSDLARHFSYFIRHPFTGDTV